MKSAVEQLQIKRKWNTQDHNDTRQFKYRSPEILTNRTNINATSLTQPTSPHHPVGH